MAAFVAQHERRMRQIIIGTTNNDMDMVNDNDNNNGKCQSG